VILLAGVVSGTGPSHGLDQFVVESAALRQGGGARADRLLMLPEGYLAERTLTRPLRRCQHHAAAGIGQDAPRLAVESTRLARQVLPSGIAGVLIVQQRANLAGQLRMNGRVQSEPPRRVADIAPCRRHL